MWVFFLNVYIGSVHPCCVEMLKIHFSSTFEYLENCVSHASLEGYDKPCSCESGSA